MSVARARAAGLLLRRRTAAAPVVQRRLASSHADHHDHHDAHHGEHHGEHAADAVVYPKEDFSSPFWRRFVLFGLTVAAFYKFAPAPSDDTYLTRFIAQFTTPRDVWHRLTLKHLLLSVEMGDDNLLVADVKPPPVHRYAFPQKLDQFSPHCHPVGLDVDLSDVKVKKEGE